MEHQILAKIQVEPFDRENRYVFEFHFIRMIVIGHFVFFITPVLRCRYVFRRVCELAYEDASRAQRLQAEISQAKRENKFIMNNIEKSKMIKNMEEKKAAKRKADGGEGSSGAGAATTSSSLSPATGPGGETKGIRRAFKQRRLGGEGQSDSKTKTSETGSSRPVQSKIKSVLGSVFGR